MKLSVSLFASESSLLVVFVVLSSCASGLSEDVEVEAFLCSAASCVSNSFWRNNGTELHLDRQADSWACADDRIWISGFVTVNRWFITTGKLRVEALGFSPFNLATLLCNKYGGCAIVAWCSITWTALSSDPLRSQLITVRVEEHLESFISVPARNFFEGGLHKWRNFLHFAKHPVHIWRHSLFINKRKKNTRQRKPGATTLVNGRMVLYLGDLQFVDV